VLIDVLTLLLIYGYHKFMKSMALSLCLCHTVLTEFTPNVRFSTPVTCRFSLTEIDTG